MTLENGKDQDSAAKITTETKKRSWKIIIIAVFVNVIILSVLVYTFLNSNGGPRDDQTET